MYLLKTIQYYFPLLLLGFVMMGPSPVWSEDRYEYPFTTEALEEYSRENKPYQRYASQRFIQGKDIVIFGSDVTIDTPLMSNGGDVIIFTDHLHVAAPIDTRVYFDHGGEFFEEDSENGCRSITSWLKGADTVIDSYEQFYRLSDDIWDDRSKRYTLKRAKRFPEAPAGMTLCANPGSSSRGSEYFPIQAMKWENLRSGNITIFAYSITFCAECGKFDHAWKGVKAEIPEIFGKENLVKDTTFFNARGLRGSRGGMPFWGCAYRGPTNPDVCANPPNHYRRGPFRGGDAGDVSIYLVNNTAGFQREQQSALAAQELRTRVGVTGGQQGSHVKFTASCFSLSGVGLACPKAPDRPTRKIWGAPYPEEVWPDAPKARDGTFFFDSLNSDEALSLVSLRLHALGLQRLSPTTQGHKNQGRDQVKIPFQSPVDHLTSYLLATLQEVYLNTTHLAMDLRAEPLSSPSLPYILGTIFQTRDQPFTFSPVNSDLYFSLAQFHFYRKKATLNSYLRDIGGLLNLQPQNPFFSMTRQDSHEAILPSHVFARATSEKSLKGGLSLFEHISQTHDAEFKKALQRLHVSLSSTVKTVSSRDWFSQVSEALDGTTSSLLDLMRQYDKHQYDAMFHGIVKMGEHLFIFDKERRQHMPSLAPSRHQFSIFGEYRMFLERLQTIKNDIFERTDSQRRPFQKNSQSLNVRQWSILDLYKDFLRLAIIEELRRGTSLKSPAYFRDLHHLEQLVRLYPKDEFASNIGSSFLGTCESSDIQTIQQITQKPLGNPLACLRVVPSKTHWTELRVHSDHKILGGVVLYRFPPGAMRKVIYIGKLFYDYDLQWDAKAPGSPF